MPVRVAAPTGIGGLVDTLLNPSYSTAVGLLQWGAASLGARRADALRVGPGAAAASGRAPRRAPEHLPVDTRELTVRTGRGPRAGRPDRRLRGVPRRRRRRRRAAVGLRAARHGRAGRRRDRAPARTTDLLAALDRLLPARGVAGTATATARPGTAPTTSLPLLAPPSLTVPVVDGRLALGHVAVDLPARSEPRQRRPDGPAELPRRLIAAAAPACASGAPPARGATVRRRRARRGVRVGGRAVYSREPAARPGPERAPTESGRTASRRRP